MRIIILMLATLVAFNSPAVKLKITNNSEPEVELNLVGSPTIEQSSGNIVLSTTSATYNIVNGSQFFELGFFPDDYEVVQNQKINVKAAVANAVNCVASTSPAGATSWNGAKVATNGLIVQNNVTVSYSQLPATLYLNCDNHPQAEFVIIKQPAGSTGNPAISSFTVNSQSVVATVNAGTNNALIQWSTTDVSSCTTSSSPSVTGWNGEAIGTSGSKSITVTQNTVVTLTCDSLTPKSVTINYSVGNPNCSSSVIPSGLSAKNIDYTVMNQGFSFGTNTNTNAIETFSTSQYLAISDLSTTNPNLRRSIQFYQNPTNLKPNWYVTMSISECPGDFTNAATCKKLIYPAQEPSMYVSTNQSDNPNIYCIIEPNKSYYLNFVHDNDPYDSTPGRCAFTSDTVCSIFFNESHLN